MVGFVGRHEELKTLDRLAERPGFSMVVVYGRRRVGKTALIAKFCEQRRTLWFTAREQSSANNLEEFSQAIYRFFGIPQSAGSIGNWMDAFTFIAAQANTQPAQSFIFVFDEFPYAAASERSLPSILQIAIDHGFSKTHVTMILCGSNEGFMASEVLGSKSPLYGRRNAQIRLRPFDLFDAAKLLPAGTPLLDRFNYYATMGGTPYYLKQLDAGRTYYENIRDLCFSTSGLLYNEPELLLRQELREPALYNSLLSAIGGGKTRPKEIAERAGVDPNTVSSYLMTLESLGLIERIVPFGENPSRSRKGLWRFSDPFFAYWYRFVSPAISLVETGTGFAAARRGTSGSPFETYVGQQFEGMCLQWLLRQCREEQIDLLPTSMGRWWGTDPTTHAQADIDVVIADSINHRLLFAECKWRNTFDETEAIRTLKARSHLVVGDGTRLYYLFSKRPVSQATKAKAQADPTLTLIDAANMFRES